MNELNKLISQYERETKGKAMWQYRDPKNGIELESGWKYSFVLWLASRPTCGVEQRKFLDEIEKLEYVPYDDGGLICLPVNEANETVIAFDSGLFTADLQKVIKGE